jgi:GNAT superfamily N-acetyltransferase
MHRNPPSGRRLRQTHGLSYRITTWTPADRDDVLALIVDIQRGEFGLRITAADQPDLTDVAGFYQAGGGEFWVARDERSVAGTIAAIDIGDDTVALRKMFVAEAHRAAGLAAILMRTLVEWADGRGIQVIYLGTTAVMAAAHRFYEKHGFALVDAGELPERFPRMEVDSRFYRRRLEPRPPRRPPPPAPRA